MKITLISFLLLNSFACLAKGATPALAVDFYRDIGSLFPSGETHLKNLEKNKVKEAYEFSYLVQQDKRQFWVDAKDLTRDIQLSKKVIQIKTKTLFSVVDSNSYWLYVKNEQTGQTGWQSSEDFSTAPDDLGIAINLTPTSIRESPTWKSQILITLPATSRLEILNIEGSWAFVKFQSGGSVTGYVDVNNLLLKSDFASFVLNSENKWIPVKYREGDKFIGLENQQIPLFGIRGMKTRPDLAIVAKSNEQKNLLLRQHLSILKTEADVWNISRLEGHGLVYWKNKNKNSVVETASPGISNDKILEREIYSVSFDPKNPNFGLISANGIFLTTDGKTWQQIKSFQNQNYPVLVTHDGSLLVGNFRSQNNGKTFEPFIKWEALAKLIEEQLKSPPKQLKISGLELKDSNILKIQVDTGIKKISFASRLEPGFSKWEIY